MDFNYYKRVVDSYILRKNSHLNFWHCGPEVNDEFNENEIGQYYMPFISKARCNKYLDDKGVPLLNYQGFIGLQYNTIAILQWSSRNYRLFLRKEVDKHRDGAIVVGDWLIGRNYGKVS
jgi:hypothetical protein